VRISCITMNSKITMQALAFSVYILLVAVFFIPSVTARIDNTSTMNKSPEEIVSQMRERLHLTEEQTTKIRPIIEESSTKRRDIFNSNADGKAMKSALQQVQWTTDIKLGQILTKEQMEEYQNLSEEQRDRTQSNDTQRGRGGGRGGGMRGF
jgi:hypothetical protein